MIERRTLAQTTLLRLKANYARDWSLVGHRDNIAVLPVLRALERSGLIRIEIVTMNKSWVVTAAGVIWLALLAAGPDKRLSLDRDILTTAQGYWMTLGEATDAVRHLDLLNLCAMTNEGGQRPDFHTLVPLYASLRDGDPLHDLARFQPEKEDA